jgi:hypothetical protein
MTSVETFWKRWMMMNKLTLRDEAMFHQPGRVNRRNLRVWGSENPHELFER